MNQVNDNKPKPKAVIKTIYTLINKKKMKDRTFTYAKIVKLIDLYQENNCLWNICSPDFRRQEKRQAVLAKIAKIFDITSAEVKRKIRSLRATYLLERRKVIASEKKVRDGLETCLYEPVLAWYKYMSFLDDIIVFRTPTTAEGNCRLSDSRTPIQQRVLEDSQESHFEKIEEIYYDNDDDSFKHEEVTMPTEYLEARYLTQDTVDHSKSSNVLHDDTDSIDQQNSFKDDELDLGTDNEELTKLKADRIRAETEYFRKKAQYLDICIEKEKTLQPLMIAKIKLEIQNMKKKIPKKKIGNRSKHFNL